MPKTYAAGDQLTASDYNAVVKTAGLYAADSVGSDSYAITVSPVPTTYAVGDVYRFKAGTANTGSASLNVNTLGAITIKKNYNQDLVDGDIVAGQICEVVYDSNGNFQLISQTSGFGAISSATVDNAGHQVIDDCLLFGYVAHTGTGAYTVYSDSASTPTTVVATAGLQNTYGSSFCVPVKKSQYYRINSNSQTVTAFLITIR